MNTPEQPLPFQEIANLMEVSLDEAMNHEWVLNPQKGVILGEIAVAHDVIERKRVQKDIELVSQMLQRLEDSRER